MPSRNNRKKHKSKHNSRSSRHSKTHRKTQRKTQLNKHKSPTRKQSHKRQRGGFNSTSCSLATVQEPGFSIPAIGDVPGFSLTQSQGAIHRPNCKIDTYQAMTP